MEFLQSLFENSTLPFLSAFLLGLMTAVSPCPLATNITAIGFVSRDIEDRRKVFLNGLVYTAGRAVTYTGIGLLFYFGADQFSISGAVQQWGEKLLGPILIVIGIIMLDLIPLRIPGLNLASEKLERQSRKGYWGVLLLGIAFALAFCPYSGVLYFGMLIPMSISSPSGLYLPLVFAIATGIPVIIFSWIIAFSMGRMGEAYDKVKLFEKWFRRIVSILFIVVGIYLTVVYFL